MSMRNPTQVGQSSSRLFLALWPEPTVRNRLVRMSQHCTWPPTVALERPNALHMTLHFLGNVPNANLPELMPALKVPFDVFELPLHSFQLWSNEIAVLAPTAIPKGLSNLHAALAAALQSQGIQPEARAFRPHVTLARKALGVSWPEHCEQPLQWHVTSYALVKSQPSQFDRYHVIQTYK